MHQAVPLCAVLQLQDHQAISNDIGANRVIAPRPVIHVGLAFLQRRSQHGRLVSGVEHVAAWKIQRQAQFEGLTGAHFGHALPHFGGR